MEKRFRSISPTGQISSRDLRRQSEALEQLVRVGSTMGPRWGPTPIRGHGVSLDDPTPRPFWARITGRDPAFEATLVQSITADDTEFEVSYDETNGTAPHQMPFYAHLVSADEVEGASGTAGVQGGVNVGTKAAADAGAAPGAEQAPTGADEAGIGGQTGNEGGGSSVTKQLSEPELPGQEDLPEGTGRKGGPATAADLKECGDDGNPKAGSPTDPTESQDRFESILVTAVKQLSNGNRKWTVERGQLCTSAQDHDQGDKFEANIPYRWDQIAQLLLDGHPDRGNWNDYDDGRHGVFDGDLLIPAFEVKGIKVPTNGTAKVLMWLGFDSQTYYLFTFFGGCGSGAESEDTPTLPTRPATYPCDRTKKGGGTFPLPRIGGAWVVPGKCQLRYYCTDEDGKPKVKTALTTDDKDMPDGVAGLDSQGRSKLSGTPTSLLGFVRQFGG